MILLLTAIVSGNSPVLATCASRIFPAASWPLDHAAGDGIRYCQVQSTEYDSTTGAEIGAVVGKELVIAGTLYPSMVEVILCQ